MSIVFIKQHDHTLMLNLSKQLRITQVQHRTAIPSAGVA